MSRIALIVLLLAAGPALGDDLPEPPIPPEAGPADHTAPMPNREAIAGAPDSTQGVSVAVRVFSPANFNSGFGYSQGSRFRMPEERKPVQTPGLSVTVPLQ